MGRIRVAFQVRAIDDRIHSLSLSFESMDIHHYIRRLYQTVLQLGCKNLVWTSVNGFSCRIVIAVVWRINRTILNCKKLKKNSRANR